MSIEADPKRNFGVTLTQHLDRPEEQRPVYYFRYLSIRDRRNLREWIRGVQGRQEEQAKALTVYREAIDGGEEPELPSILSDNSAEQDLDAAIEIVTNLFVGWKNPETPAGVPLTGEFDSSRFDELFDERDLGELVRVLPSESSMKAIDRKNSCARSLVSSASVAKTDVEQPEG